MLACEMTNDAQKELWLPKDGTERSSHGTVAVVSVDNCQQWQLHHQQ